MTEQSNKARSAIAEQASDWYVLLHDHPVSAEANQRFLTWLLESPVHVHEYLAITKLYADLGDIDPEHCIDVDSIIAEQVASIGASAHPAAPEFSNTRFEAPRWRSITALAASVLVSISIIVGLYVSLIDQPTQYRTALGEQRSVVLEDGSIVSLNTLTQIAVSFSDSERHVQLLSGEALFDVEKDVTRPFIVDTNLALVKVTGTTFNVNTESAKTAITVLEGHVQVNRRSDRSSPDRNNAALQHLNFVTNLAVGEQAIVTIDNTDINKSVLPDPKVATAWTDRKLIFDHDTVRDVVAQFNRYNRKQFVIEDDEIQSLELNGVFSADDTDSLTMFLASRPEIEVIARPDGVMVIRRALEHGQ